MYVLVVGFSSVEIWHVIAVLLLIRDETLNLAESVALPSINQRSEGCGFDAY